MKLVEKSFVCNFSVLVNYFFGNFLDVVVNFGSFFIYGFGVVFLLVFEICSYCFMSSVVYWIFIFNLFGSIGRSDGIDVGFGLMGFWSVFGLWLIGCGRRFV